MNLAPLHLVSVPLILYCSSSASPSILFLLATTVSSLDPILLHCFFLPHYPASSLICPFMGFSPSSELHLDVFFFWYFGFPLVSFIPSMPCSFFCHWHHIILPANSTVKSHTVENVIGIRSSQFSWTHCNEFDVCFPVVLRFTWGHAVAQLVEAPCYKPGGRGFDSRRCHWNFSLT